LDTGAGDWTQVETIRHRADNHRNRKCRETEDTRGGDFKIKQETQDTTTLLISCIVVLMSAIAVN